MSEAVFVQGLTKTYGGKTVVDHLNLSVSSGTVFGLLGANGAGKSTTIECMLGTKKADAGTVRLMGQDPKKHRRMLFERIGVQFQSGDYQKEIKVSELCEETASLYRAPADWRKLCGQFGIGELRKQAIRMDDEPVSFAFLSADSPLTLFLGDACAFALDMPRQMWYHVCVSAGCWTGTPKCSQTISNITGGLCVPGRYAISQKRNGMPFFACCRLTDL